MTPRTSCSTALLVVITLFIAACASNAARTATPSSTDSAAATPAVDPMMDAMMKAATPSPMHAWLLEDVGHWTGSCTSWPSAAAEPMHTRADFVVEGKLGGRFVQTLHTSEMPEGIDPFEGIALTGFDNAAGQFESTWIDCFGTAMMTGVGTRSADGRTLDMRSSYYCPIRRCRTPIRHTITRDSANTQTHRMWSNDFATGKEYLMMEAVYTRAK